MSVAMTTEKTNALKSNVLKMQYINWQQLQFIQHENFKEWDNNGERKLLESLIRFQFVDPFKVWDCDGVIYCLDGKHRYNDLLKAKESNFDVPDLLPAVFINCRDKKEAAELVLAYSSSYARISQQGFYDFVKLHDINYPDLNEFVSIPNLDVGSMKDWFLPEVSESELIGLAKHNPLTMKITFKTKGQYETAEPLIKALLQQHCPDAFYSVGGGEL
jgi:hypothetical protein